MFLQRYLFVFWICVAFYVDSDFVSVDVEAFLPAISITARSAKITTIHNKHHVQHPSNHQNRYIRSLSILNFPLVDRNGIRCTYRHSSSSFSKMRLSSHDDNNNNKMLEGCVCLVTGASRGIGKGIAIELGKQGATVYITGTSSVKQDRRFDDATRSTSYLDGDLGTTSILYPGTIEETANDVTNAGGIGIPVYCNHSNDTEVEQLFQCISMEQNGQLHLLVNNVFQTPSKRIEFLSKKFWEQGSDAWDSVHTVGLRSHYMASCYAMPLMFAAATAKDNDKVNESSHKPIISRPLVIMIGSFGGLTYTFNVAYGVGKAGVDRLAKDMAIELNDANKDISVISLWPGVVRTEVNDLYIQNGDWEKHVGIPIIEDNFESTQFTGKAVVALALDPNNLQKSGTYQVVAELAAEYNFYDDANSKKNHRPPSIRSLRFLLPTYGNTNKYNIPSSLIPDWKMPFWLMAQGRPSKQ